MTYLLTALLLIAGQARAERAAIVVQAEGSPVKLDRAVVLAASDGPPVLLYSATNLTADDLDQFTVMVLVYDAKGILKARHIAPGRHLLDANSTKYSAMVLDGAPFDAADTIIVGVNQAQRAGSDAWWRADLRDVAEAALKQKSP